MMKSAALQRRIRRLKQGTLLHRAEAAILEDMLHASRPEALPLLDFVERYLPKTLPKPRGSRGRLIGEDWELNALRSRIRHDTVSAVLWKNLLVACRRLVAPGSPDRIDWRTRTSDLWRQRSGHWRLSRDMQQLAWVGRLGRIPQYEEAARQILMAIVRTRHGQRCGSDAAVSRRLHPACWTLDSVTSQVLPILETEIISLSYIHYIWGSSTYE